jgi:putative endonuclease
MYIVYILYSQKHNQFYTGFTTNIMLRLSEHNSFCVKSTKAFAPWTLVYQEECKDRILARKREKYWKSGSGREKRSTFLSKLNLR